jgi:polyhydroxyalkanoate synthesis repressor PhaR
MLVKKYGNRRLYDTEDSRYVRLAELAEKVRRGSDVRVIDATTGNDLTAETLVQIIFEDRHAARLLPVSLLHQMIRMGDDSLAEFLGRYVTWALEVYFHAKQGLGAFSPFSPLSTFASFMPPFGARGRSEASGRPEGAPTSDAPSSPPRDDDIAELRRELEELKRSLRKRGKQPSR